VSGIKYLADTNSLIYLLEGRPMMDSFIQNIVCTSIVSEIELMGWYKITQAQKQVIINLLLRLDVIELSQEIKELAIEIKQQNKIKLPDAIIAATSLQLDIPLLTADMGFQKIKGLNSLILTV
jgi:predicted nucleic acid-binding protein